MTGSAALAPPIVPYLRRDADGAPYLAGTRCEGCGQVYVGDRTACAKCLARDAMTAIRLPERGTLYSYTIVHRSFPGTDVPFIDAIVDLEGGGHLKGTLSGVEPDPRVIAFDMPVRIAFREAAPANAPDQPHLTYIFLPA